MSSIDSGADTAKGYRVRFGNFRSIVSGVVRFGAVRVAAAEVRPRARRDGAALGRRLVVREVRTDGYGALAQDLLGGGIDDLEGESRRFRCRAAAANVLDLGRKRARRAAAAVLDRKHRIQRRPARRLIEI